MEKAIISIIEQKIYIQPLEIARPIIELIKLDPSYHKSIRNYSSGKDEKSLLTTIDYLSELDVLLKLMSISIIPDIELELVFTKMRSTILFSIFNFKESTNAIKFLSTLALHCHTNEYVYNQTPEEDIALKIWRRK